MNKTTEALKLAEEALERWREWDERCSMDMHDAQDDEALAAIRAALAVERSEEALADHIPDATKMVAEQIPEWVDVDDYEEPVKQEPVAFMFKVKRTTKAITVLDEFAAIDYFPQEDEEIVSKEPLSYAAPVQPVQEPVAWVKEEVFEKQLVRGKPRRIFWECVEGIAVPIYTVPPTIEAAVLAEREACAKLCDEESESWNEFDYACGEASATKRCAAAIQARGEK